MNRRMMVLATTFALAASSIAFGADKAQEQAEVSKAAQEALAAVYKAAPSARAGAVKSAAGYAAFSNFGMKILVAGAARARASRSTTRPRPRPT